MKVLLERDRKTMDYSELEVMDVFRDDYGEPNSFLIKINETRAIRAYFDPSGRVTRAAIIRLEESLLSFGTVTKLKSTLTIEDGV